MDFDQYLASYGISRNDIGEDDLSSWYVDWERTQQQAQATPPATVPGSLDGVQPFDPNAPDAAQRRAENAAAYAKTQGTTGGGGDFASFWREFPGYSPADLKKAADQWNASHPNDKVTLGGSKGDKATYQGKTYDAILSAGLGGTGKAWNYLDPNGSSSGAGSSFSIDPSYLAPFTKEFNAGPDANQPTFRAPAAFKMPTKDDVLADPSYQFRFGEGLHAIDNGAAARGLINSGGTLTDEQAYGQNFASQEYGNIFNRNFNLWNTDWQHALDEYGTAVNRSNEAYGRARQGYLDQRDTFQQNQSNPFDKLYKVGSLGASAASA